MRPTINLTTGQLGRYRTSEYISMWLFAATMAIIDRRSKQASPGSPVPILRTAVKLCQGDPIARFHLLRAVAKLLVPEYRFQWPQLDWWDNENFNAYLNRFEEAGGMNSDRRWALSQLLRLASDVEGHTAECGVLKGAGSFLMCSINRQSRHQKRHHLFDSFQGLSTPDSVDGSHWKPGDLAVGAREVMGYLREFSDQIELHEGWIPHKFESVSHLRFSAVHVDVDLFQPTFDSLEFFYPLLNPGGILICDDYGFSSCPGATLAVDKFFEDKEEKMVSLPSGGGFILKGVKVPPALKAGAGIVGPANFAI